MKKNKIIGIIIFILGGLSLLAWPILGFSAIFMFDAPLADRFDESFRYASVVLVLSYPVGYGLALPWFITKWKKRELKIYHSFSGIIPILHLALAIFITDQLMKIQHDRKNPDIQISENLIIDDQGASRYLVNKQGKILVDRNIGGCHFINDETLLIVSQAEVEKLEFSDGSSVDVHSADAKVSYFVVNIMDESVAGPFTLNEVKEKCGLSGEIKFSRNGL